MKIHVIGAMVLALTACAKLPSGIPAASIPANSYLQMSCQSLSTEKASIVSELNGLNAAQTGAAIGDTVGVFLLLIPVGSLAGADQETAISIAKGKISAIETAQAVNECL